MFDQSTLDLQYTLKQLDSQYWLHGQTENKLFQGYYKALQSLRKLPDAQIRQELEKSFIFFLMNIDQAMAERFKILFRANMFPSALNLEPHHSHRSDFQMSLNVVTTPRGQVFEVVSCIQCGAKETQMKQLSCKHSVCIKCLTLQSCRNIEQPRQFDYFCKICRKKIILSKSLQALVINELYQYEMIKQSSELSKDEIQMKHAITFIEVNKRCPLHRRPFDNVCFDCECFLCSQCEYGMHRDHLIEDIFSKKFSQEQLIVQYQQRIQELKSQLQTLDIIQEQRLEKALNNLKKYEAFMIEKIGQVRDKLKTLYITETQKIKEKIYSQKVQLDKMQQKLWLNSILIKAGSATRFFVNSLEEVRNLFVLIDQKLKKQFSSQMKKNSWEKQRKTIIENHDKITRAFVVQWEILQQQFIFRRETNLTNKRVNVNRLKSR